MTALPEVDEYADDFAEDADQGSCMTCHGEGWVFCEDWDCWEPDCDGTAHTCWNCHGSGDPKDQWLW